MLGCKVIQVAYKEVGGHGEMVLGTSGWGLGEWIVDVREIGNGCGAGCFCVDV